MESKYKNIEGINLVVGVGISMHFTKFFTLSQVHILVVLFTEKCLAHNIRHVNESLTPLYSSGIISPEQRKVQKSELRGLYLNSEGYIWMGL